MCIFPYDATIIFGTCNNVLAVIANITAKNFVLMSLKQANIFPRLTIPYPTYSIETSAKYKIILGVESDSSDLSLMPSQSMLTG